jgi:hypothetical protein
MNPLTAVRKAVGLARFARNLRGFLDEPLTLDEAVENIENGVRRREQRFLEKLQSAIYGRPKSPYYQLLHAAGCEFGDVRELVTAEGLEGALEQLAASGVFVSYEEFKGVIPAVRGSRTFHFQSADFDDPNQKGELFSTSGGSRGRPVATVGSLAFIAQMTPHWAVFFAENDCLDKPLTFWTPGHAGATGRHLWCAKIGRKYVHWFLSEEMSASKDRIYSACKRWLATREGGFVPPIAASCDRPEVVLHPMLALLARGAASMNTTPSAAVKLSLAAQSQGLSLSGLTFLLGAEPLTPDRRTAIEASGARATPLYGSTEAAWVGGQCRQPQHPDEVHVLLDSYAVILDPHSEPDPDGGGGLLMTALQPLTNKVLLNTDIGDRGILGQRRCDCLYDRLGCTTTIHTIRSSDKITEYGVNIAVSDVFQVLENDLPRRFGGTAGDYQLVESRNANGLPRYTLRIDPVVPPQENSAIISAFLTDLSRRKSYYGYMTAIFQKENLLRVVRAAPVPTPRGKILPFYRQ